MHNIDDILAKHFSGLQLQTEEEKLLAIWKLNNPKEFEALQATMLAKHAASYTIFDHKKGWDKMSERIDGASETKVFSIKSVLIYSAVASIALLISLFGFQFFNTPSSDMIVFENKTKHADSLLLPDGSKIFLAKNSTIEYAVNFNENRSLILDGEAFFKVTKNKDRPFTIDTKHGLVRVLGTSFNVNANNKETQVDVSTGLVSLSNNNQEIKLSKNESAQSNGQIISQKTIVDLNNLAWRTGHFSFDNTPFEEVIKFLETFYGDVIDVQLKPQDACSFTGTFSNENIDGIIEALVLSCNLEFSEESGRIILK